MLRAKIHDIYIKQMLLFFIIIFVFCILESVLYTNTADNINKKSMQYTSLKVSSFLEQLENDLQGIKQMQDQLINDESLQRIALGSTVSQFDEYKTIWDIQDSIYIIEFSSYVDAVYVDIPYQNIILSTDRNDNDTKEMLYNLYTDIIQDTRLIRNINDQYLMIQSWPAAGNPGEGSKKATITIALSTNKIMQSLKYLQANNDYCFFASLYDNSVIMSEDMRTDKNTVLDINKEITDNGNNTSIEIGGTAFEPISIDSDVLGMRLIYLINKKSYKEAQKNMNIFLWIFFAAVIVFAGIFFILSSYLIKKPLTMLEKGFKEIEKGNYRTRLERKSNDNFTQIFFNFNQMTFELERLIEKEYKQQLLLQESHLQYLQAQIKPHFLYNCFFTMSNMLETECYEEVGILLNKIGKFYQYIHGNWKGSNTLYEEIQHASIYSEIQKLRFGTSVDVFFGVVPDKWKFIQVPYLIIQPLIENSFKHGFKDKENDCRIVVEFIEKSNVLEIEVSDNGGGMDEKKHNYFSDLLKNNYILDGSILLNINKRLNIFFSGKGGLYIENMPEGGFKSIIRIEQEVLDV